MTAPDGDGDPFSRRFGLDLAHGRCVAVSLPIGERAGDIPEPVLARLHPDEARHVATLGLFRRAAWAGGRLALRAALADLSLVAQGGILQTARGAPLLPDDVVGSISHKEGLAVGLAARAAGGWRVGVDLERVGRRRADLAGHVLRPEERDRLSPPSASDDRRQIEVLRAFSAKEAIYKALDPFVGRMVAFHEVAVVEHDDGSADVTLHLRGAGGAPEGPFQVELAWLRRDDLILSTARVRRR